MSNSIAPGSSADVNVKVTALTINPNVPVTYKTIILKKNLVNGVNTLTQEMMSASNIKYVIKYDYVLGNDITVPENCVLEFDGGSLSNGMITFSNTTLKGFIKFDNIQVNGNVSNYQLDATIFNKNDIGDSINKCAAICKRIVIPDGIFYSHTKIRLSQHTLCGTNKLNNTANKGSSIIYTDIDDAAIECIGLVNLIDFRIQNTKNSLLNSIGLKCIGTVNINNIRVTNYIKYGFVSGGGLYYSVIQGMYVGMDIGFGIGSIGIYITGTADSSTTYNANANTFIETVCQGGYEVLVKVVGNGNTFLGGDFSVNNDNTVKRQLEILGALNSFIGSFYLENPDKCSLDPICLYKTAKHNIINLSAPLIGKIKNESRNYNLITTYDYYSFENDFKYLGENLFDYYFQIDKITNLLVSQGYYIKPYYGGNGGINNCQFSLLEEKYKGNSILRMSFNNSNANNLTFEGTDEFRNVFSSKDELICISAYIRSNIDNATIGLSNATYKKINEWEFISIVINFSSIKYALNGLIKVKSSELLNGYIDVAGIKVNVVNRDNIKKSPTVDYFNFYKNNKKIRLDYDFLEKIISKGTTEQRPTFQSSDEGFEYYDSTLKKKILWNGSEWTNLDGTSLE